MAVVTRLHTLVDIEDGDNEHTAGWMSVSALHQAVLDDGRRVVLLDDRDWTGQLSAAGPHQPGIAAFETIEGLECEARDVVGPDEPVSGFTHADMEARHWATLAGILHEHDVVVEPAALSELPHDVELSARLRARVRSASGDSD
jgi:hypothetical protein